MTATDYVANADALLMFVDHIRARGVKTYKGEVPLPDGTRVPIDVSFERADRKPAATYDDPE